MLGGSPSDTDHWSATSPCFRTRDAGNPRGYFSVGRQSNRETGPSDDWGMSSERVPWGLFGGRTSGRNRSGPFSHFFFLVTSTSTKLSVFGRTSPQSGRTEVGAVSEGGGCEGR